MANGDEFIKDRGNMKWTSMMLPEHREQLRALEKRAFDLDPPSKSEEELAELAERAAWALRTKKETTIDYWENHRKKTIVGRVERLDPQTESLLIATEQGEKSWIQARHIFSIEE